MDYYFAPPIFSFRISDPFDGVAVVLFWATSAVITTLVSRVRIRTEQLVLTNAKLEAEIAERKRAEAAGELFRSVADTAPVMIWRSGPDKLCTFFNKPWLDFTGRTMEQELGEGWAAGVHPADLDRCLATYSSSFDARQSFQMEYRIRRADGEYRCVLDNGTPLYREAEFLGYIGSCIDVTEQTLLAERLRRQALRLKEAERLAKVGSWERDLETGIIDWSDQALGILGISTPPIDVTALLAHVHPKDREKILEAADEALSSVSPAEVSFRIIRPDGEVRFVRAIVEATRDSRGAVVRTMGVMQDISGLFKALELIRESEERLKNAERLSHVGHWDWDIKANRVSWSEENLRIFGKPQSYISSFEGFIETIVPQDRERVARWVADCLAEKRGNSIEFQIAWPNGDVRTITCTSEVPLGDDGSPARMFGACQDVTDVRRAQEESFARQKLESVGTLANGIAHDFNNLLGGVLAQTELVLAGLAAGLHPEDELKGVQKMAIHGSEIVRQLMMYAGKERESVGPVGVSQVAEEMLPLLKVSVSKRAVLETHLGQDLPAVRASAAQIRQIVLNLVTNASEAIGNQDGVICVITRRVTKDRGSSESTSQSTAQGDYVELEVSDTGPGIPLEAQARLFDPYFTTKSTGRGLGLAVVDGIVRSLGGEIHLASEPGKGATFQILLPCAERAATAASGLTSPAAEAARLSQGTTVLVVEDEDPLRQAVAKMLNKSGFEVFEAADGSAAIDLLRASGKSFDVILLDLTIPGPSSHEIVTEYAKARPDSRVILTSAYSEEMAKATLSAPQIRAFLRKPFQFGELMHTLRNVLPAPSQSRGKAASQGSGNLA